MKFDQKKAAIDLLNNHMLIAKVPCLEDGITERNGIRLNEKQGGVRIATFDEVPLEGHRVISAIYIALGMDKPATFKQDDPMQLIKNGIYVTPEVAAQLAKAGVDMPGYPSQTKNRQEGGWLGR